MQKLYNTETILRSHGGDQEFLKYIASLFVEELPKMSTELQKASSKNDWENLYFYAHKMKATIDLFSIDSLKDLIRKLEHEGKTANASQTLKTDVAHVVNTIDACILQIKKDFSIAE